MSNELEGTNPGELDFQQALNALPPEQQQELADQMQSHVEAINSLRDQAIQAKAQNVATANFNAAMDAYQAQHGTRPNRHQMASMYAAARARAGFTD